VKFKVSGTFDCFYLCHCTYCRKGSGSAHAANLFSASAQLKWISGERNISAFSLPSTRHHKSFCATCGSALPFIQPEENLLMVPAGSLDTDITLRPYAHIFCSSRANWDNGLEDVDHIPGEPV